MLQQSYNIIILVDLSSGRKIFFWGQMRYSSWVAGVPLPLVFYKFFAFLFSEPCKFTLLNLHSIIPFHIDFAVCLGASITACFIDEAKPV